MPVAFYCGWLLLTALLNIRLVRLVTSPAIAGEEMSDATRWSIRRRGIGVALGAATALGVSLLVPRAGQPALMSIPFWMILLSRFEPRA